MFVLVCLGALVGFCTTTALGATNQLPELRISVHSKGEDQVIDVILRNNRPTPVELSYSECDFSYVINIGGKVYTWPTKQPFEFASPCPGVIRVRKIPAQSRLTLFSRSLTPDAASNLKAADHKITGEFRFRYSPLNSGQMKITTFKMKS